MSLKSEEMMSTTKPHDLYGPQVIELVMSKPGNIVRNRDSFSDPF